MYRLKHLPTGMYYKPGEHTLSRRGKVYQTKANAVSGCQYDTFTVTAIKGGPIQRETAEILLWEERKWRIRSVIAETKLTDWIQEPII